ncbi:hypothetical protein BaRGS_00008404 [Batillaria attramentaria]|uniref:Uncharacterized protein n=1 Tax=Batillaria attramentaria TaxID=370345 RepID=A0ABD0LMB0_9CAEN
MGTHFRVRVGCVLIGDCETGQKTSPPPPPSSPESPAFNNLEATRGKPAREKKKAKTNGMALDTGARTHARSPPGPPGPKWTLSSAQFRASIPRSIEDNAVPLAGETQNIPPTTIV